MPRGGRRPRPVDAVASLEADLEALRIRSLEIRDALRRGQHNQPTDGRATREISPDREPPPDSESAPVLHVNLTVIETSDPVLLEEVIADRNVRMLIAAQLSSTVAIGWPQCGEPLVRNLQKSGHLPRVVE